VKEEKPNLKINVVKSALNCSVMTQIHLQPRNNDLEKSIIEGDNPVLVLAVCKYTICVQRVGLLDNAA